MNLDALTYEDCKLEQNKSKYLSLKGFKFLYNKYAGSSMYDLIHFNFSYVDFMISTLPSIYIKCKNRLSEYDQVKIQFLQNNFIKFSESKKKIIKYDRKFLFDKTEFLNLYNNKYKYELDEWYKSFFIERNKILKERKNGKGFTSGY